MTRRLWVRSPAELYERLYKMELAALSLGAQHNENIDRSQNWSSQCQYNVTGGIYCHVPWDDITVKQHSKSEYRAICHIQTLS